MKSALKRHLLYEILILAVIFLLFFGVQATKLTQQPWDHFGSWRQVDTYSIALNYLQYDMNPLMPQFNYDGLSENYVQLELQIMPYLSALLFLLTGTTTHLIPRILCLLFFAGSAVFLYLLIREFCGKVPAMAGVALYLFAPLSLQIARAIQPEACMLFFLCGGIYFLRRFQCTKRPLLLWLASGMTAVAIMEKTPAAFIGLLFLYVLVDVLGKKTLCSPLFYGCGLVTLVPPIAHFLYSSHHSVFHFMDGIAVKHIFSAKIFSLFTSEGLTFFKDTFAVWFGWAFVALAAVGLMIAFGKKYRFLLIWAAAFLLETATIAAVIKFEYYLVFLLPVFAALCAIVLKEIGKQKRWLAATVCIPVLILTSVTSLKVWERANTDTIIDRAGNFIAAHTAEGEGVAIGVQNPAYFTAANRRGYRANIDYYDYIPSDPQGEIQYFIDHGVRWFAVAEGGIYNDADGSYLAYLREHFSLAAAEDGCELYDLTKPLQ
ncbi:MAG: glycosyltransferase family 39 protein [Clostridia bacterium]|nr:glycosyltransferase family 39 protein [Clostridia bacterium]